MNIRRYKLLLQTFFCALLLVYATLFYQNSSQNDANQIHFKAELTAKKYNYHIYLAEEVQPSNNDTGLNKNVATIGLQSSSATIKPPITILDDIFISVKTSQKYHSTRLRSVLKTWFRLAQKQTWFFTDADDAELQEYTHGHFINTNCLPLYEREALCCKMSAEYDAFLVTNKKWFCHFDDDNYVNVPRLVQFLGDYNPRDDWYFGKQSVPAPLERFQKFAKPQKFRFWFGTGGAGICLSRALALKMMPFASQGRFIEVCDTMRLNDDMAVGYIIEYILQKPLTVVRQFHSHLEPLKHIRRSVIADQISLSYKQSNVVKIEGFDEKIDANRFLSLHCFLFPYFAFCPRRDKGEKERANNDN